MTLLSYKPMDVIINDIEANIEELIQMLNNNNYPSSFSLIDKNSLDFIEFTENGPNRYTINSGNNPHGLGRRHAMGGCERKNAGLEIMRFFGVDQIAGGKRRAKARRTKRGTKTRRAQRQTKRNRARN